MTELSTSYETFVRRLIEEESAVKAYVCRLSETGFISGFCAAGFIELYRVRIKGAGGSFWATLDLLPPSPFSPLGAGSGILEH